MSINIYPNNFTLRNSDGDVIGEPTKDTLRTEDRLANPLLMSALEELRAINVHLAEMLGDDLRD